MIDDREKNRATPLYYIKQRASFQSHRLIQTGVTVWKRSIRVNIGDFYCLVWPWNLIDDLEKNRAPLLCYFKLCESFHSHLWIETGVTIRKRPIWVKIYVFQPCDLEIWQMALKNNRALHLCYFKLCASFNSHLWIQTGVTLWKRPIWIKSTIFFSRVTLKFDRWPWKTIGHHS